MLRHTETYLDLKKDGDEESNSGGHIQRERERERNILKPDTRQ